MKFVATRYKITVLGQRVVHNKHFAIHTRDLNLQNRHDNILKWMQLGLSANTIARRLGIQKNSMLNWCKRNGIHKNPIYTKWTRICWRRAQDKRHYAVAGVKKVTAKVKA